MNSTRGGIQVSASAEGVNVIGNYIYDPSTFALQYNDNEIIQSQNNMVEDGTYTNSPVDNIKIMTMRNSSGGTINAGDVVVWDPATGEDRVTTTTTGGNQKVIGMAAESISNGQNGWIKTEGKTKLLKVNGTADIAVGDFISTYTTAGIGKKATSGETAFAIALEAYTTDDNNGVIDALLIPPRTV